MSFLTPDPAGNRVASPADPQNWNQYAYVRNNPATLVDPFGLFGANPVLCSTSAGYVLCSIDVYDSVTGGNIETQGNTGETQGDSLAFMGFRTQRKQ